MINFETNSLNIFSNFQSDLGGPLSLLLSDDTQVTAIFNQLLESIPSDGVCEASIPQLPEFMRSLFPWPSYHHPFHTLILVAEISKVPLTEIHPARLYLFEQSLVEASRLYKSGSSQNSNLSSVFTSKIECARDCLTQVDPDVLISFRDSVRSGQYSKNELQLALEHPFISEEITGRFFSWIADTQIQSYTIKDGTTSETPAGSYPYLGSDPSFIVRFMRSKLAPREAHIFDLGCGGGAAIIPFALLSNYSLTGMEIDSSWLAVARRAANNLKRDITFRQESVLEADLSCGTIFYIYSPFEEITLCRRLVDRLEQEGRQREILVLAPYIPVMHHALSESSNLNHLWSIDKNIVPCGHESATAMHVFSSRAISTR